MHILVDAREAYRPRRRGTGKNLIDLYAALAAQRPEWRFTLAHEMREKIAAFEDRPNIHSMRADLPLAWRFNLWQQVVLPAMAAHTRCDVLHAPANTGPRVPVAPMVLTVHDLIPLEIAPDDPATKAWLGRVAASVHAARAVITPSAYTKRRLIEALGTPSAKITVNPWAPDGMLRRVTDRDELDRVRMKFGLRPGEPYVFSFGASDPRKNTRRVVAAYAALSPALRATHRLLVVGIQEPALTEFRSLAQRLGVAEAAQLHSFAQEEDIGALLSGATLLCFVSLSEGFGLPVLDAFLCGTPVLGSDRTSIPEVLGDAGIVVDPTRTEAIAEALTRMLEDESLRVRLAARGLERLGSYSWEATAARLARIFEHVSVV